MGEYPGPMGDLNAVKWFVCANKTEAAEGNLKETGDPMAMGFNTDGVSSDGRRGKGHRTTASDSGMRHCGWFSPLFVFLGNPEKDGLRESG